MEIAFLSAMVWEIFKLFEFDDNNLTNIETYPIEISSMFKDLVPLDRAVNLLKNGDLDQNETDQATEILENMELRLTFPSQTLLEELTLGLYKDAVDEQLKFNYRRD